MNKIELAISLPDWFLLAACVYFAFKTLVDTYAIYLEVKIAKLKKMIGD